MLTYTIVFKDIVLKYTYKYEAESLQGTKHVLTF